MKNSKIQISRFCLVILVLIISITLFSCFSQWQGEEGTIIINLGAQNGRSNWPPDTYFLQNLIHKITLTGNGLTIVIEAKTDEVVRRNVSAGFWNVKVDAYFVGAATSGPDGEGIYYATGSSIVEVQPEYCTSVIILMNPICQTCGKYPCDGCEIIIIYPYIIVFDLRGGNGDVSDITVAPGEGVYLPQDPTKAGYMFKGWSTSPEGTNILPTVFAPTGNTTLYAVWEQMYFDTIVIVYPEAITIGKGNTYQFSAVVDGIAASSEVVWSISGQTSTGTFIDQNGQLIVSSNESAVTIIVTATSMIDNARYGSSIVTVVDIPEP